MSDTPSQPSETFETAPGETVQLTENLPVNEGIDKKDKDSSQEDGENKDGVDEKSKELVQSAVDRNREELNAEIDALRSQDDGKNTEDIEGKIRDLRVNHLLKQVKTLTESPDPSAQEMFAVSKDQKAVQEVMNSLTKDMDLKEGAAGKIEGIFSNLVDSQAEKIQSMLNGGDVEGARLLISTLTHISKDKISMETIAGDEEALKAFLSTNIRAETFISLLTQMDQTKTFIDTLRETMTGLDEKKEEWEDKRADFEAIEDWLNKFVSAIDVPAFIDTFFAMDRGHGGYFGNERRRQSGSKLAKKEDENATAEKATVEVLISYKDKKEDLDGLLRSIFGKEKDQEFDDTDLNALEKKIEDDETWYVTESKKRFLKFIHENNNKFSTLNEGDIVYSEKVVNLLRLLVYQSRKNRASSAPQK